MYLYIQFRELDFEVRTIDEHLHHYDELETDEETSMEYGVNRKSILQFFSYQTLCTTFWKACYSMRPS